MGTSKQKGRQWSNTELVADGGGGDTARAALAGPAVLRAVPTATRAARAKISRFGFRIVVRLPCCWGPRGNRSTTKPADCLRDLLHRAGPAGPASRSLTLRRSADLEL